MNTKQQNVARLQSRIDTLQASARQRTARAIARRRAKERLPDLATIGSFDSSDMSDREIDGLERRHAIGRYSKRTENVAESDTKEVVKL